MRQDNAFQARRGPTRQLKNPPAAPPAQHAPLRECWSVRRVADYFDVTPKRIYLLIEQGRLRTVRLGPRQTRITRSSIEHFLSECDAE